ncbi:MAG: hypothetical protein DRH24_08970 [Deltaproteobacteria bacterium]|nr:MAG: hypothetical protein DRH24_08970 [Deltaproteobacteria bacterium]
MQKPKICFVCENAYLLLGRSDRQNFIGGAELQQLMLAQELTKRDYEVVFITNDFGQQTEMEWQSIRFIPTYNVANGLPFLRFFYPKLFKLWKGLAKANADIYYLRCAGFELAPLVFFTKRNRKKVIFCGADERDFDPKRVALPILRDRIMYFWGLRRCDAIVAQNKAQQCLLRKNFLINASIIYNGFRETQREISLQEDILWVANFLNIKQPWIFLEIARHFPDEQFVMVGGRTNDRNKEKCNLYDAIASEAKRLSNVKFKGFLPFELADKQFDRAKVFINTSLHEGFPNTFLQAWSRKIPVISFVDPDNLIRENRLGLVATNTSQMIQHLSDFLSSRITFSADNIRTFYEANFSIEQVVDKYEKVFRSLMDKAP